MRVALLGDAQSIHTIRWANGLVSRGVEVHLITIHPVKHPLDPAVTIHRLRFGAPLGYLLGGYLVKRVLEKIQPDLLNAHFAGGYGLIARVSGFRPLLLSVWGSDIYKLPHKSPLHYSIVRSNLAAATAISSTSHCMAEETRKIFHHPRVFITPFGVDEEVFRPAALTAREDDTFTIGTVKTLRATYGIDTLLDAFALVLKRASGTHRNLVLEITGDGKDLNALQSKAAMLGIAHRVTFRGAVPYSEVPKILNRLDVYVALSRSESFGVAVLEACACERPVVVSDAEGLTEVTTRETGIVVPKDNPLAAAEAIYHLMEHSDIRRKMGTAGRLHVLKNYTWPKSVDTMLAAYRELISS